MEHFFVAGCADDPEFAEAEVLGDYLVKSFPQVSFTKDMRHPIEWAEFRSKLVRLHGFTCPGTSSVIWRRDGRLVGNINDFRRVLKDMYNLELEMDTALMQAIVVENIGIASKAAQDEKWTPYYGKAKKEWKIGVQFDGTWKDHHPIKGVVTLPHGTTYEGGLQDGKYHGHGRQKFVNGAKFVGTFSDGKREGQGKYQDAEGNIYTGMYSRGLCHGKGTRTWPNGREYVGRWIQNEATGRGIETIPVKIKIEPPPTPEGEDEPAEPPEPTYIDGKRVYTGDFLKGTYHGTGLMEYETGDAYEGTWVNGRRQGPGIFSWVGKNMAFEGVFENDVPTIGLLRFEMPGDNEVTTPFPGEIKLNEHDMPQWVQALRELALDEGGWLDVAKDRLVLIQGEIYHDYPINKDHNSAMARILDRNMWQTMHRRLTTNGTTVHTCIAPGLDPKNTVHPSGLLAGDPDCYLVFRELFDGVIRSMYHEFDPVRSIQPTAMDDIESWKKVQSLSPALLEVANSWTLQIDRSIGSLLCSRAIDLETRRRIEDCVVKALLSMEEAELTGEYFPLAKSESFSDKSGGMSAEEEENLRNLGALFEEADCSDTRDWPDARGVFISNSNKLVVHINKEEHVSFICTENLKTDSLSYLQDMFRTIAAALTSVETSIFEGDQQSYARSDNLGFLTMQLDKLGTGMTFNIVVTLPRLAKRQSIDFVARKTGLIVKNIPIPAEGKKLPLQCKFALSVPHRLGISEIDALNSLISGANEMCKHEKSLGSGRKKLWMLEEQPKILLLGAKEALADDVTHATKLAKDFNLELITSATAVQTQIDKDSKLGQTAKWYLEAGKPVEREVVCKCILESLKLQEQGSRVRFSITDDLYGGPEQGWVCNGFPASPEEVELLKASGIIPNKIISFKPDDATVQQVIARRLGRRRDKFDKLVFYLEDGPALSFLEFTKAMSSYGISRGAAQSIFTQADTNKTGKVSLEALIQAAERAKNCSLEPLSEDRGNLPSEAVKAYQKGYEIFHKAVVQVLPVQAIVDTNAEETAKLIHDIICAAP
jgi:adenylate kinase family enzyme